MTQKYIVELIQKDVSKLKDSHDLILQALQDSTVIDLESKLEFITLFEHMSTSHDYSYLQSLLSCYPYLCGLSSDEIKDFQDQMSDLQIFDYWLLLSKFLRNEMTLDAYNKYLDSDVAHYSGNIIITDPCYIVKPEDQQDKSLSELGIRNAICKDTIYGDWSCTTFDSDSGEVLGEFCADSGRVCVCDLTEVLKYRPDFVNYIQDYPHAVTHIQNFEGNVQIIVDSICRDAIVDYEVHVVGHGKDIQTHEPVNFITRQTGF